MDLFSVFLVALGLSADCFAVALSSSITTPAAPYRLVLRTAFAFGLFQFLMPVAGWLAGRAVVDLISAYDHWVAFGLLAIVGGKMVYEPLARGRSPAEKLDISRLPLLLTLSVATSIDALAVGLSSAFLKLDILTSSLVIGTVAFSITALGFLIGKKTIRLNGRAAKLVGGLILIGIGFRILMSHVA
ncbi:MAG: manganese efflux pump [Chloroflexi bacterium]|nr:manganese efflux pump [Chloroflexota bacterium]